MSKSKMSIFQRILCLAGDHEWERGERALVCRFPYYAAMWTCTRCKYCGKWNGDTSNTISK